jgi:hypothetical protein
MRPTRFFERPKTLAILEVEGKGVVISVRPNLLGEFRSSKSNWYGSTSSAFANLSRVASEGAV